MKCETATWTFSTLGCPKLDLEGVCALADQWDVPVLEIRALHDRIDLPAVLTEFYGTPERVAEILAAHNKRIRLLDTSFQLMSPDPAQREEFLAFLPWAEALQVPLLRVFDGGVHGEPLSPAKVAQAVENVRWWQDLRRSSGWNVDIAMETHTTCATAEDCLAIERGLEQPLYILWDTHPGWTAGEPFAKTWQALSPYVRHMHVKDSAADSTAKHGHRITLPGEGEFPWDELQSALRQPPYEGTISLEWERKWVPELPPLDEALAAARNAGWF